MIVNVAQNERTDELININDFFKLLEITSKNMASHPTVKRKVKNNNSINEYSGFNCNKVGYKTMSNGFYYDSRTNSINKDPKNFRELSSKYGNPYFYALSNAKRGKSSNRQSRLSTYS